MLLNKLSGAVTTNDLIGNKRCTGRTTGQAFALLSTIHRDPGVFYRIVDHFGTTDADVHLSRQLKAIIGLLGLKHIQFSNDGLMLRFNLWEKVPHITSDLPDHRNRTHLLVDGVLYVKQD